jgi:hypothetical protein
VGAHFAEQWFPVGSIWGSIPRIFARLNKVAEIIAGQRRRFDPAAPPVGFTDPEIVTVARHSPQPRR